MEATSIKPMNPGSLWIQIGHFWFKYRSFSPLPFFLLVLGLAPEVSPTAVSVGWSVGLIALGEAVRIWAVGYAGSSTRTRGNSVHQLVHAGPFRYVRNPIYWGNIFMYLGTALLFGFYQLSIFVFAYFYIQYTFIIRFEESILTKQFGEVYLNYQMKVNRWWPRLQPAIASSGHSFQLKPALRSERTTFVNTGLIFLAFAVKTLYFS